MVTRQVINRAKRNKLEEKENKRFELREEIKRALQRHIPYREAIGSLMYLANVTRPDIAYAVNYLYRKQLDPTEEDWIEVKRIFRYLRGTPDTGIIYRGKREGLEALTDASFTDCYDSTSTGGYIIRLFGDTIAWRSHKQTYVTLSTCQAEYLAIYMSDACQDILG